MKSKVNKITPKNKKVLQMWEQKIILDILKFLFWHERFDWNAVANQTHITSTEIRTEAEMSNEFSKF